MTTSAEGQEAEPQPQFRSVPSNAGVLQALSYRPVPVSCGLASPMISPGQSYLQWVFLISVKAGGTQSEKDAQSGWHLTAGPERGGGTAPRG